MNDFLPLTRDGAVAVLTIDRPDKRNALTAQMWADLPQVLEGIADDPVVRVLVVTGAGGPPAGARRERASGGGQDPTGIFGVTPAKVGIVYPPASTRTLMDLVGPAMTKYLLFSGELVDAPTALHCGRVDRLVDAADLEAEVHRFADVLASRSALSQRATKEVVADLARGGDGAAAAHRWYRETVASAELAEV